MRPAILFFIVLFLGACQPDKPVEKSSPKNELHFFQPLVNSTWSANGKWANDKAFKQEVTFSYDLNNQIVVANSNGYIDEAQTQLGKRNHGIRKYNPQKDVVEFWEFDAFGGLTTGEVYAIGQNIYYRYDYNNMVITDGWEFKNKDEYVFRVGIFEKETWKEVYLETSFKRVPSN